MLRWLLAMLLICVGPGSVAATETIRVAVAANFKPVLTRLIPEFANQSSAKIELSAGSTGQLTAQISNGAPFDLFLAADQTSPGKLVAKGLAIADSRFTYAKGRLALLLPGRRIPAEGTIPDLADLARISIANPRTAPYGIAAMEVLDNLDIAGVQLVLAQNAGGVVAAVASGAAPAGLTSLSLADAAPGIPSWTVPEDLHSAISQDAILLHHGAENATARAFLDWLKGNEAREIIRAHGYVLD